MQRTGSAGDRSSRPLGARASCAAPVGGSGRKEAECRLRAARRLPAAPRTGPPRGHRCPGSGVRLSRTSRGPALPWAQPSCDTPRLARSPGTPPPGPLMPWTPRAPHRAHGLATRCARVCPVSSPESSPISVTHFLLFTFSRGPSRLKMRSSLLESGSPSGCREHREGCVSVRLGFFPLLSCHPAG